MTSILDIQKMVNDGSLWLAIIAINMTIIGLTSLAETKNIIGVDYGKYLIKFYKILGIIRMYYLLVLFAMINIISLISMFTTIQVIRTVNFVILLLSVIFAIYYFFAFILIENPKVKRQIYRSELLGMYYKSNNITNFEADKITNINNGWRTEKRLSTNVISYFNLFNRETQIAFEEIFGPDSIIYDYSNKNTYYWKKTFQLEPFDYKSNSGLMHLSHEFFQLYRYSELQEKWLLEILRLFNLEYSKGRKDYRLDNVLRVMAHINRFGNCKNLFSYKFLEYLKPYICDVLTNDNETLNNTIEKQKFLMKELVVYVLKVISKYEDREFYRVAVDLFNELISVEKNRCSSNINERIDILFEEVKKYKNDLVSDFTTEIYNIYYRQNIENKRSKEFIINLLNECGEKSKSFIIKKEELFIS